VRHKTLIAFAAAVALGCVPVATNAVAAGHPGGHGGGRVAGGHAAGGHAMLGHARGGRDVGGYAGHRTGPIYDSCPGYDPNYAYGDGGCPGYGGVPLVGRVINGILGGYGPY
jgi:hypothetical protein